MNRLARRVRAAATIAALTIGAMSAAAPFAAASNPAVPFTDTNVAGWLTFCNQNGQPVTSGSLYAVPFVWKAISSAAPPAGYRVSAARATLYAFQPIKFVDPADWSGSQLTGSTSFTNPSHAVAQATNTDQPLLGFTQAYPPRWDSLVEIRMLYSGAGLPQIQTPYAAAVVRITGTKWTLVEGGGGSCSQGQGVSDETKELPKKYTAPKETVIPAAKSSASPAGAGGSSASTGGGAASGQSAYGAGSGKLAADSSSTGIGTATKTGIGLAVVALGGVAIFWWRRRAM
jgi:hypothetical protein